MMRQIFREKAVIAATKLLSVFCLGILYYDKYCER